MKLTLERASLLKSLGHVHRVVERRNTIPILSNVLLRILEGAVAFKATDLDMEVSETVPAEIAQAGGVTAPAHTLYEIVRKLPEGSQVTFESTGESGQMTLRSGRSRFTLSTLPESDFPDLSVGEMPHRFEIAATVLKRLFDKTHFAISTEETRYYLNGVFLHEMSGSNGSVLRAVATDGHRLARVETEAPQGAAGMPSVIVPRKAVAEIQKLLEDQEGDVTRRIVRDEDPRLGGFGRADLEAHRWHFPGLSARHSRPATTARCSWTRRPSRALSIASRRSRASAAGRSSSR